jgi:hypothetical protein
LLATVYIPLYKNFVTGLCSLVCPLKTILKFNLLFAYTNHYDGLLQLGCVDVAGLYTASTGRSAVWGCGRLPPQIVGSNPAEGMEVCLL